MRRGLKKDFDPSKMLPGEWAVSIDSSTENQIVWMCFAPGVCKRIGTYEDFQSMINEISGEIIIEYQTEFNSILDEVKSVSYNVEADKEEVIVAKSDILETYIPQIEQYVLSAESSANTAESKATEASDSATLSQSYAVGGTASRVGEDTDNAKYYYEESKEIYENFQDAGSVTGVKGANETNYRSGQVNLTPDNIGALAIDGNAVSATKATQDEYGNVISSTYVKKADIVDNLVSTSTNEPLSAKQGKVLNDKITAIQDVLTNSEGVVLWENANPGAMFAEATISITAEAAQMYRSYEILYLDGYSNSLAGSVMKTTGKLPFGTMCSLSDSYPTLSGTIQICGRRATVSATQAVFKDAIAPDATVNANWYCIPYKVIFYP